MFFFGLFHDEKQIGFLCYANYVPHTDKTKEIMLHANRSVIHPDYVGIGLGQIVIDITAKMMKKRGFRIMTKFSSLPTFRSMLKSPSWILKDEGIITPKMNGANGLRQKTAKETTRQKQKWWSFEFIGVE